MPRAAIILLLIGIVMLALAAADMLKSEGQNPIARKTRLRVGVIFVVLAVVVSVVTRG